MIVVGIVVAAVMIALSVGQLGDGQHVTGTSLTGGQSAQLAIYCGVTGIILLARKRRRLDRQTDSTGATGGGGGAGAFLSGRRMSAARGARPARLPAAADICPAPRR